MSIKRVDYISDALRAELNCIHKEEIDYDLKEKDIFLVYSLDNKVIGYCHSRPSISHLLALYVLEDYQRGKKKIGSSLLTQNIKMMNELGVHRICLGIEPFNEKVIQFYQKHGFRILNKGKSGFTTLEHNGEYI